jgi:hypothetical protein
VKHDDLIYFIKKFLAPEHEHLNSLEDVVLEAVAQCMAKMMETSNIPFSALDLVQEHLMEDAWDIIRKITYGSLNLQDYRLSLDIEKASKRRRIC